MRYITLASVVITYIKTKFDDIVQLDGINSFIATIHHQLFIIIAFQSVLNQPWTRRHHYLGVDHAMLPNGIRQYRWLFKRVMRLSATCSSCWLSHITLVWAAIISVTDVLPVHYRIRCALQEAELHTVPHIPVLALRPFWNDYLDELEDESIVCGNLWENAGKPKFGHTFSIKTACAFWDHLVVPGALKYKHAVGHII